MKTSIEQILDRMEPDTPPSRRFNRLVRVGRAQVLELRDPNSGQSGGPADKPRHQYIVAGGQLWSRRLPPESVGDEWLDIGAPKWEPVPATGVRAGILAEWCRVAPMCSVAVLRRQEFFSGDDREYVIRGKYVDADHVADPFDLHFGPITGAWWDVPLPPCPDCGGEVEWYEAGYVPGTRRCRGCGSFFSVSVYRERHAP